MRFSPKKLIGQYQQLRPVDATQEEYAAQMTKCQSCAERVRGRCRAAGGQPVSLMARRKITCPLLRNRKPAFLPKASSSDALPPIYPADCTQADVVFFLGKNPAPGWWTTKGELSVRLLKEVGITAACVVNPNDAELPCLLDWLKTKLLVNRGFLISPETTDRLAIAFPKIKFLAMNHSSYPFLVSSPWAWKRHTQFMAMAERRKNCYVGTPDERNHLAAIRPDLAAKLVWIPNGSDVPAWRSRPMGEPPLVSLIGAGRQLKNFPNQLAGFALAARSREMRLLLSVRGEMDELLAEALGYLGIEAETDVRPWVDWQDYQDRIRAVDCGLQVSFTESFNYVGLEHLLLGAPVVGSTALRFLPTEWRADPEDPQAIAAQILDRLGNWEADSPAARRLATRFVQQRNRQFQEAIAGLLEGGLV